MIPWFLAPMLDWTRFPFCPAPRLLMCSPAPLPPTNETAFYRFFKTWFHDLSVIIPCDKFCGATFMCGLSQTKLTASCCPCTMFRHPAGSPASSMSWTSIVPAPGTRSDGFMMNVLPHINATGYIHSGIMAGKLKGQTPATTPSGSRNDLMSKSCETDCKVSPWIRLGIEHACSTTNKKF